MTSLLWNTSYFLYTDLQLVQLAIRHPVDCAEAIKEFPKDNFHKTHFAADEEVKKLFFSSQIYLDVKERIIFQTPNQIFSLGKLSIHSDSLQAT